MQRRWKFTGVCISPVLRAAAGCPGLAGRPGSGRRPGACPGYGRRGSARSSGRPRGSGRFAGCSPRRRAGRAPRVPARSGRRAGTGALGWIARGGRGQQPAGDPGPEDGAACGDGAQRRGDFVSRAPLRTYPRAPAASAAKTLSSSSTMETRARRWPGRSG